MLSAILMTWILAQVSPYRVTPPSHDFNRPVWEKAYQERTSPELFELLGGHESPKGWLSPGEVAQPFKAKAWIVLVEGYGEKWVEGLRSTGVKITYSPKEYLFRIPSSTGHITNIYQVIFETEARSLWSIFHNDMVLWAGLESEEVDPEVVGPRLEDMVQRADLKPASCVETIEEALSRVEKMAKDMDFTKFFPNP